MSSSRPTWLPPAAPDLGEGTHAPRPDTYASAYLRAHGQAWAEDATRRFYELWPALMERYGERGRQHTYDDQFWHLATLDTALRLGTPLVFTEYVTWLRGFLAGHGMGDQITCANFVFFLEAARATPVEGLLAAERMAVMAALDRCGGNRTDAARQLGIHRQLLYRKIEQYGLRV